MGQAWAKPLRAPPEQQERFGPGHLGRKSKPVPWDPRPAGTGLWPLGSSRSLGTVAQDQRKKGGTSCLSLLPSASLTPLSFSASCAVDSRCVCPPCLFIARKTAPVFHGFQFPVGAQRDGLRVGWERKDSVSCWTVENLEFESSLNWPVLLDNHKPAPFLQPKLPCRAVVGSNRSRAETHSPSKS